ncbi:4'-phosphopantetheinyl transferase [Nocardia tenerifensis]|uniref:4'-phosphopantetheinyl transferase n=1 Tax=Nocardia tenerifensis TaxID=228006 RepID=A0A318KNI7_9NOCA|nr:4'-phosphopantetheinyl transferase superfamily protein [Nocardia tenerifensis]PXX71230.1 4'-phosphopantetheinyl transferase [Nocardia tenerifensis]
MIGETAVRRVIAPGAVELWWLKLNGRCLPEDSLVLSAEEISRCARFDTAEFASDFVRIRATLRCVLAAYTGCRPSELRFATGPHGKPELPCGAPAFNLTHTRGLAVVAVAGSGSIGVDAEPFDAGFDLAGLTGRVLTPREAAVVGRDRQRFLHHWVAKESYLKWLGSGLSVSPDTIELRTDHTGRAVVGAVDEVNLPTRYVHHFDLDAQYVGAFVSDALPQHFPLRPAESVCAETDLLRRTTGVQA